MRILFLLSISTLLFYACESGVEKWKCNENQIPPQSMEKVDYGNVGFDLFKLVNQYYQASNGLFKENYPEQSGDLSYSYLWPYNSLISGAALLNDLGYEVDYKKLLSGLNCYWSNGVNGNSFGGFGASTNGEHGIGTRYYDDNSIVGITLIEAYKHFRDKVYLDKAKEVVKFLKTGEDNNLYGALWWNESEKNIQGNENSNKPACANGYAAQFLLEYYKVCPEVEKVDVLDFAKRLYGWIKQHLEDTSDHCYWNSIDASGFINKTKWTYNTGVMIQNGVDLYQITSEKSYLEDAIASAKGSYVYFVRSRNGVMAYPDSDPWFNTKLLRGYLDIIPYYSDAEKYIKTYADNIDYAYKNARTSEGFFYEDWTGKEPKRYYQLLMQDAVIESSAALGLYYNLKK